MEAAPPNLWDIAESLGTMGILAMMLWFFISGRLWPEAHVREAIEQQRVANQQAAELIANNIRASLEEAIERGIERGIIGGIAEARRQNGGRT